MSGWRRGVAATLLAGSLTATAQGIAPIASAPMSTAGSVAAVDDPAIAEADVLRDACMAPFAQAHPDTVETLDQRIVAAGLASLLLERLSQGAPPRWREGLLDARVPETKRVQSAIELIGMAVSEAPAWQRPLARAYSARFAGAAMGCTVPPGLAAFVARTDFWTPAAASSLPTAASPTRP